MKSNRIIKLVLFTIIAVVLSFWTSTITNAQDQVPITRSQAEQRALNMINLKWNYSAAKNGTTNSDIIMQPQQFHGVTSGQFKGIPYNWGGFDSLDSKSDDAPWVNFLDAINKGAYAGNVNTDYRYGYIPGTAGIDCSGFIQASFNIKSDYKLSTFSMFDKYFKKISVGELRHMDILNKSDWHVAIFDRWGTLNGVNGAFTYESTPEFDYGGIEGTKRYFMTLDELHSGYVPGRYVNLIETPAAPAPRIYSSLSKGNFAIVQNVNEFAYFRVNPWTSSPAVGWIPKGTVVYLEDYSLWWFKVTYKGVTGWIWSGLLAPIPSGVYVGLSDAYHLNVRTAPSSSGQIIGLINKGEYPEVIRYSDDYQWMRIRYDGLEGWASAYYLKYVF